jgi:hypothetical protein
MVLFLLFSVPLLYLGFTIFMQYESKKFSFHINACLKGILWFLPSFLIYFIMISVIDPSYKPFYYFLFYFFRDHFLFCGCALAGYFIFYGFSHPRKIPIPFLNHLAFFAGFFTLVAIKDFFSFSREFNIYILFILPFLRLFSIIIMSFLVDKFIDAFGMEKIPYGGLLILVPICTSGISYCYNVHLVLLAFILSVLLFAGAGVASYFLRDL